MGKATITLIQNFAQVEVDDSANTVKLLTYDSGSGDYVTRWTLDSSTGNITLADSQTIDGTVTVAKLLHVKGSGTSTFAGAFNVDGTSQTSEFKGSIYVVGDHSWDGPGYQNIGLKTLTGKTAGAVYWQMPERGKSQKELLMYFSGYESTSGTQTIAFPTTFAYTPMVENPKNVSGLTVDTTHMTIDPGTTTAYTGFVRVWGF